MDSTFKTRIIDIASGLMQSLENLNNLSIDNVSDEKLTKSFENIKNIIFWGISNIKKQVDILIKIVEWDRLNIAYFGETNAGKSTIIESLINGDGRSIGEGYKDFTKTVNKIAYHNVNLMDMPGIEGREHRLLKNIFDAVSRSHIVFYIVGTNKEPEENTITKIKNFLKDNVKVYSVINVRGKPTVYKHKPELIDQNILIVENRIKVKFGNILAGNYSGNVVVNGYLALLSGKRLKNTRFENDQAKAIDIFGSRYEIERFSNIQEINSIIEQLSNNIHDEIKISNTYKFLNSIGVILSKILREKKSFDSFIKESNELINKYLCDVDKIISKYNNEINASLYVNLNTMRVNLKKSLTTSIDDGENESSIKIKLDEIKQQQSEKLHKDIKSLLSDMKDEIEAKIKEFKSRMSLQMQFINLKGEFNLELILESLEVSFKYVLGQIADVGLSIWGVVLAFGINPILGVVAGVLALARKIWDWFFGDPDARKREAKGQAIDEIDLMVKKMELNIRRNLERELLGVNKNAKEPVRQLDESLKGVKNISRSIDIKISEMKRTQKDMSFLLMQEIIGGNVIFSFIDLQLSEAVVIGFVPTIQEKFELLKKLRIKKINLYPSYHEWLGESGLHDAEDVFVAKDEFNFRAINALMLHENTGLRFNKVRRSEV